MITIERADEILREKGWIRPTEALVYVKRHQDKIWHWKIISILDETYLTYCIRPEDLEMNLYRGGGLCCVGNKIVYNAIIKAAEEFFYNNKEKKKMYSDLLRIFAK